MSGPNNRTATPTAIEVAAVQEIVKVLENNDFTYREGLKILPFIEEALSKLAFQQKIKMGNRHPK